MMQLYKMHFFAPLDYGRTTSLNHHQTAVGSDGRVRFVVAHEDPGVPNWLDTMGRWRALLNFRHFWGSALPTPKTRVVPFADVHAALPPDTPTVDAATREQQIRARRDHLAWRFRT
jgi:hypothetical protein